MEGRRANGRMDSNGSAGLGCTALFIQQGAREAQKYAPPAGWFSLRFSPKTLRGVWVACFPPLRVQEATGIHGKKPTQSWVTASAGLGLAWPGLAWWDRRSQLPVWGSGYTPARPTLRQVDACSWRLWLEPSWSRAGKGLKGIHVRGLEGESLQIPGCKPLTRTHSFVSPLYPMLLKGRPIFQEVGALGNGEEKP